MPRVCTVCTHPEHVAIDRALIAGEPYRVIAQRFAASPDAVLRHKQGRHLPVKLALAEEAKQVAEATDLLAEVRALRSKAYSLLLAAERQGDIRTALAGVREARACLELLAEMEGELDRRPTINVLLSPEWQEVRAVLLDALRGYPDARTVVSARLLVLERSA